jgi:TPR repeat protein/CHAT domain-containing protein
MYNPKASSRSLHALVLFFLVVGFAQSAKAQIFEHQCDLLAAAPSDPSKQGPGVPYGEVDASAAIPACEDAAKKFPTIARFRFQLARALNKAERYEEAVSYYRPLATSGYAPAAQNLAVLMLDGKGVAKDPARAVELVRWAAEAGYSFSQRELANFYSSGTYVERDPATAAKWYGKAADQGDAIAQNELGLMYQNGVGVEHNPTAAVELYRKSALQGFGFGQANLGTMYAAGSGVPQDYAEAAKWYTAAADQGDPRAQNDLGVLFQNGTGVSRDAAKAFELYHKSASQKYILAELNLGWCYATGFGVQQDFIQAVKWYALAADAGNAQAQQALGALYENGTGVTRDFEKSVELYKKSASQGYALGQASLGRMYARALGVTQDYSEAAKWYRAASNQGNAWAENELGDLYFYGNGVEADDGKAFELYEKSASQGFAPAQYSLGWLNENGRGVGRDTAEAVRWFSAASEQGNASAQNSLARMYRDGSGVEKDYPKALQLFLKSAEQGNVPALSSLAYMFANGLGVAQNYATAQELYLAAAKAGNAYAMAQLGWMSRYGRSGPIDELRAYIWYSLAADAGYDDAFISLGELSAAGVKLTDGMKQTIMRAQYQADRFIDCKPRRCLLFTLEGSDSSEARQQLVLNRRNWRNKFTSSSDDTRTIATQNYAIELAVDSDPLFAQNFELAKRAITETKDESLAEAQSWFQVAIQKGSTEAALSLANLHLKYDSIVAESSESWDSTFARPKPQPTKFVGSVSTAAEIYDAAIKKGSKAARINLAALYELGQGVPRDLEAAGDLYRGAIGTRFEGPAWLGLLRLSLEDLWQQELVKWRRTILADDAVLEHNDIVIEAKRSYLRIAVADPQGRRVFGAAFATGQKYSPPRERDDLIVWFDYASPSEDIRLTIGQTEVKLPIDTGRYGIRLNRALLAKGTGFLIEDTSGLNHLEMLPDETLAASRVTIKALTDSYVYYHGEDHVLGLRRYPLYANSQLRLPAVGGLSLELRPTENGSGKKSSSIAIAVDGNEELQLSAPPGCIVTLDLTPEKLLGARVIGKDTDTCETWGDNENANALVSDGKQEVIGRIQKSPNETVAGVIGGSLGINRGIAYLQMTLGQRYDEAYRAANIFYALDVRESGPNSLQAIRTALDICDNEIRLGLTASARSRLDMILSLMNQMGSIPTEIRVEFFYRFGSALTSLGRYPEAERFLLLSVGLQERKNLLLKIPPARDTGQFLISLSAIAEGSGDPDKAIMYELHALNSWMNLERSERYNTEYAPVILNRLLALLRKTERIEIFKGLLPFAHREAKREIARDVPEPFALPLDLTVFERSFGSVDRSELVAGALGYLAQVYSWMGRHAEAVPLMEQLVKTRRNIFGETSVATSVALAQLAEEYRALGSTQDALIQARKAYASALDYVDTRNSLQRAANADSDALKPAAFAVLEASHALSESDEGVRSELAREAFEVAQRAQSSTAALALQAFGDRLNQRDPQLRQLVRRRQDLTEELVRLDASLISVVANASRFGNTNGEDDIHQKIERTEKLLRALDVRRSDPGQLDDLFRLRPFSYSQIQSLLHSDEVLITFLEGQDATFGFAASREELRWFRIDLGEHAIGRMVATLRCGVDVQQWSERDRIKRCHELVNADPHPSSLPFDINVANKLYRALFDPIVEIIRDKHLIFALSGPLSSLPPQLLVTSSVETSVPLSAAGYRHVAWLSRQHAITVLPSVGSLASLRRTPRSNSSRTRAPESYLGLGDPKLSGNATCKQASVPASCLQLARQSADQIAARLQTIRGVDVTASYFRGVLADVEAVRRICPLPETSRELTCVAQSVGAKAKDLVLGAAFTETIVKGLPLDRYRIIHFATHGLLAEQTQSIGGIAAEPALVLTPPKAPTAYDDGLLTASEIAQLKLNADWVVLSACNTAAGERVGSEALSGLARAFFYAGARTLLASHWAVDSSAAVFLTTRTFSTMARNASISPAEGHRRAMMAMMDEPAFAHPATWAPFVVIGEGSLVEQ